MFAIAQIVAGQGATSAVYHVAVFHIAMISVAVFVVKRAARQFLCDAFPIPCGHPVAIITIITFPQEVLQLSSNARGGAVPVVIQVNVFRCRLGVASLPLNVSRNNPYN